MRPLLEAVAHDEIPGVEVDVLPPQVQDLALAEAGPKRRDSANQSSFDEPFRSYAAQGFAKEPA